MAVAAEEFLTTAELAELLRVPVDSIYQWRHKGEGPPAIRVGKHLRFRRSAVDAWLESRTDAPAR